jgi:hypothetical protein
MSANLSLRRLVAAREELMRITYPLVLMILDIAFLFANCSWSREDMTLTFRPTPRTDPKGFIDVWQLRKDVSAVEQLDATDDTESCSPEGDPDETLSRRQIERQERESAACQKRVHTEYAIYQQVWKALNSAWLPSIYNAISRGDRVAEVIMRQCETT